MRSHSERPKRKEQKPRRRTLACAMAFLVALASGTVAEAPQATLHPALQVAYQIGPDATPPPAPTANPVTLLSTQGLHPDDEPLNMLLCLSCAQTFTALDWNLHKKEGHYIPASMAQFEALGITFTFYAADDRHNVGVDIGRLIPLVEEIYAAIPPEYRRNHVESVKIIVSSEDYCLGYDYWSWEMRNGLVSDYSCYFTSESVLEDIGGCCGSFPDTQERERVIWLPTGKMLSGLQGLGEHTNCAYSYHIYSTEEMNTQVKFIHELVHALSISRTMPSLSDYGFKANTNWELQWLATGKELPVLSAAEALAYDLSRTLVQELRPSALFSELPRMTPSDRETPAWQADAAGGTDTGERQQKQEETMAVVASFLAPEPTSVIPAATDSVERYAAAQANPDAYQQIIELTPETAMEQRAEAASAIVPADEAAADEVVIVVDRGAEAAFQPTPEMAYWLTEDGTGGN